MNKPANRSRASRLAAPIASAAILVAIGAWGLGIPRVKADPVYLDRVARSIDAIPYSVDGLVGTDVAPTPAAVKLLNPNRILQRQYFDPGTGRAASLMVVHCADMRDMVGHYPPICYPAHGWVTQSVSPTQIEWDGRAFPAREYRFTRSGGEMSQQTMTVLSFFVLPSPTDPIVSDMDHLEQAARRPEIAGRGAAQFQVLSVRETDPDQFQAVTRALLKAAAPAIKSVLEGARP